MNKLTVKAIIFDLDNTLLNRREAFQIFSENLVNHFLVFSDSTERQQIIEEIRLSDRDGYKNRAELFSEMIERYHWKKPMDSQSMLDYWFKRFYQCSVLMDGALNVLTEIKSRGIKLGIVTNGAIRGQNAKIDHVGIRDFFDDIIVSEEVQVKKPDRAIFELALNRLHVSAEDAIFVGDHPVNDIQGATQAGMRAIWFKGFMEWDRDVPEPLRKIDCLQEILEEIT